MICRFWIVACLVLLAGCETPAPESAVVEPPSPFAIPLGQSTNYRIGFVGRGTASNDIVIIHLVRESYEYTLKENQVLLARNQALQPTALLKIQSIKGRVAIATIFKGMPSTDEEVVLPNSKTREAAETLPLYISGT